MISFLLGDVAFF